MARTVESIFCPRFFYIYMEIFPTTTTTTTTTITPTTTLPSLVCPPLLPWRRWVMQNCSNCPPDFFPRLHFHTTCTPIVDLCPSAIASVYGSTPLTTNSSRSSLNTTYCRGNTQTTGTHWYIGELSRHCSHYIVCIVGN